MSKIQHYRFANNFQVIYEKPQSSIPISSIQVFCNIGNIHAPDHLKGITHFIEHMCFKGTKEHPDFNRVLFEIADNGVVYNGISTERLTYYIIKCQDLFVKKYIEYMSEELLESVFKQSEFKKEENVVIEENINNSDNPANVLAILSNAQLYENTPFQYPTDDVSYHKRRFPYKETLAFYRENYIPANMVLSITTNLPFAKVLSLVKKTHFAKGPKPVDPPLNTLLLPKLSIAPVINGIKYKLKTLRKMRSIYLNVSFQTCNQNRHNEKYILNLFASILCNNSLASRLGNLLRQKYGLVYGVSAATNYNESGGDFTISTQFDHANFIKEKSPSVLPIIIRELNNVLRNGVRPSELTVSKHNIRGRILLDLENIDTQTNYNGTHLLLYGDAKKIVPYSQMYERCYASITKSQINECVRKYFVKQRMCVTVVGNNLPSLNIISRECERLDD